MSKTALISPFQKLECDRFHFSYKGDNRAPEEEYSLSNCTWFKDRSCCKRTEVTSVFQEMMPIDTSSQDCYNHMNYLMCYFCNPNQYEWFRDGQLHVCQEFCDDVYEHCKDAKYDKKTIGSVYSSGKAFCAAQSFVVVDDNKDCFEFDKSHFNWGSKMAALTFLVWSANAILFLL